MKQFLASVLVTFAGFSAPSFAQESAPEIADMALNSVYQLHNLSTRAKAESKAAAARREHSIAGKLRVISDQANGLSASLYAKVVNGLMAKRRLQDIQRDFQNYERYEFSNLQRNINNAQGDLGFDYPGAVITAVGAQESLREVLMNIPSSTQIYGMRAVMCQARDGGVEEHPGAHSAIGPDEPLARILVGELCGSLHGHCKIVRCQMVF